MGGFGVHAGLLVVAALFASIVVADEHWSHKNENKWPNKCMTGRKQSPINLQKDVAEYHIFSDFQFKHYDEKYPATITNNGHSVAVKLKYSRPSPSVRGAGLPHEYVLDHMHFHWESEHTLHSNRFPLELHFVHYAKIFNSTSAAMPHETGLAVLGVLFDICEDDNPAFEPLLMMLNDVRENLNTAVDLTREVAASDFLPKDRDAFFRYEGSLTTPTCDESVVWTVFYQTSYISKAQLSMFHTLKSKEGILEANYRSLQNLNGRVVVFRNSATSISSAFNHTLIMICIVYFLSKNY